MQKKLKVLVLSDHALSTSGVGTQTRHLLTSLIEKGCWSFRQFGAALKHSDYRTIVVNDDFIIKPIDGFGNPEMLRVALATEKPDLLFKIVSLEPPRLLAIIGFSIACASTDTRPNASGSIEAETTTSAIE